MISPVLLITLLFATAAADTRPAAVVVENYCPAQAKGAPLRQVTVYDGPPAEQASLVFDNEEKGKGTWTAIWKLDPANRRGYYVGCEYQGVAKPVARKVEPRAKECRAVYRMPGRVPQGVSCR